MHRAALALVALHLGLAALPGGALWGQQDTQGTDFWIGVGRFRTSILVEAPKDPPDLSGTYQVLGFPNTGDTSRSYQTTMTMKRKKVVETPQGGRIMWYEVRYHMDEPVDGLMVHIGSRVYLAYGSKNILLGVGAPLVLTPEEEGPARRARQLQLQTAAKNKDFSDNATYVSKGAPWFSAVKIKGADQFHQWSDEEWSTAGFYALWFNAKGANGQDVYRVLHPWSEGKYRYMSYFLKKGNEASNWGSGTMAITPHGQNYQILQFERRPSDGVDGTAHQLDDGTVVWVLGGGGGAGAGYYEFVNGTLTGQYWGWGSNVLGTEVLTPAPEVLAAHGALFAAK